MVGGWRLATAPDSADLIPSCLHNSLMLVRHRGRISVGRVLLLASHEIPAEMAKGDEAGRMAVVALIIAIPSCL